MVISIKADPTTAMRPSATSKLIFLSRMLFFKITQTVNLSHWDYVSKKETML
jgi:hypothetical protein